MRYSVLLICAVLVITAMFVACSPAGKEIPVSISCDDFRSQKTMVKDVQASVGDTIVVSLCQQTGSTGYKWDEKAVLGNPQVISQLSYKTVPPQNPMPGAPSTDVWTFSALKSGSCTIDFAYGQSWQGGEKAAWTLKLNMTVK